MGQYFGIAFTVIGVLMIAIGLYVTKTHKWRGDADVKHEKDKESPEE